MSEKDKVRLCKHKYTECGREGKDYWFKCQYCGHKIFGKLLGGRNEKVA